MSVYFWKSWAHELDGDLDQAKENAKKAALLQGNVGQGRMNLASIYARAGQREEAIKLLEKIQEDTSGDYQSPTLVATIKFGLGQKDEAFNWLERAYQEHDGFLLYFRQFPWWAEYRNDPRWLAIERKVELSKR